jgi:hypothetical protein
MLVVIINIKCEEEPYCAHDKNNVDQQVVGWKQQEINLPIEVKRELPRHVTYP